MKITYFLYNTFLIENENSRIAIDPGQNLGIFTLGSLIPKSEWPGITHLLITHGDPDHYWQADRVAEVSQAHVVCGKSMTRNESGQILLVAPRGKELTSWIPFNNVHAVDVGDIVTLDDVVIEAVKSVHGEIIMPILGFKLKRQPGSGERTGIGAMGYKISIADKTFVNLGDSLLLNEWKGLNPDVLMLPIGGLGNNTWTMDADEGLEAIKLIAPKHVIPCHYNLPLLFNRKFAPVDSQWFKREVEKMGISCSIMIYGDIINV